MVLPLVEHIYGPHLRVLVHGYSAVDVVPAHGGSALVVDGAVVVNLGDGTRDASEACVGVIKGRGFEEKWWRM